MIRLALFAVGLVVLIAIGYGASLIQLGPKSLGEHIHAIADSHESRELVHGLRQRLGLSEESSGAAADSSDSEPQEDPLTEADRENLRKLIRDRVGGEPGDSAKSPTQAMSIPKPSTR